MKIAPLVFCVNRQQDTATARRQLEREICVFESLAKLEPQISNIVHVVDSLRTPKPMLLMNSEKSSLEDVLDSGSYSFDMIVG